MTPVDLEDRLLATGRAVLCLAAFAIPLAFCRETMYIFQAKSLILQYAGLSLAILMSACLLVRPQSGGVAGTWALRLLWLFLLWQLFKTWDTICPALSLKEMRRVYWLPVLAVSVPFFFRTRPQFERLITVVVAAAVLANLYMWMIWSDAIREPWFEQSQGRGEPWGDFANFPVLGWLAKALFYPPPFDQLAEPGQTLPIGPWSFFAGKHDAGTFGNKNFLTTYLNITSVLMVYRGVTLALERGGRPLLRHVAAGFLWTLAIASYVHIGQLQNRGSWLGMFFGVVAAVLFALWCVVRDRVSGRRLALAAGLGLACLVFVSGVCYAVSPERFHSIFTVNSSSNELRVLTWQSYVKAWREDREQFPSGSAWIPNDAWRMSTGMGNYTFRVMYPKYRSPRIFQIEFNAHNTETSHAHNVYLDTLGELGILGLGLYLALIGFVAWALLRAARRDDWRGNLLRGAVLFGLVSVLVHQAVEVGLRYTCGAFPFWLVLGLAMALGAGLGAAARPSVLAGRLSGAGLLLASVLVMPDVTHPLQVMRSEHFYEMGQIYYSMARSRGDAVERQAAQVAEAEGKLREAPAAASDKRVQEQLAKAKKRLEDLRRNFALCCQVADDYFRAGGEYDDSNFESLYIGGNMNVQFGRTALVEGRHDAAKAYYEAALRNYDTVAASSPYFVQVRYWQAMAHSGLGAVYHQRLAAGQANQAAGMLSHYEQALRFFDLYQRQDPVMLETGIERYRIRLALELYWRSAGDAAEAARQSREAVAELVYTLRLFERGGYGLFSADKRLDALNLLMEYIRLQDDGAASAAAMAVLDGLVGHKTVTGLLPFVPKTERHVQSTFSFLPGGEP